MILVLGGLAYYESMKREALKSCEVKLADVHVKSIGLASATLEVSLSIYNPNSITATLDRVTTHSMRMAFTWATGHSPGSTSRLAVQ